ncbi:MAG: hypothetical protein ACI9NT_002082 [Bacteroidia bacterium]
MFKLGKFFKDYMQLGYVQPLTLSQFREKWGHPAGAKPVEWWYLGTGPYYHYLEERRGKGHRESWKIDKNETDLAGVDQFPPENGADEKVGILLTQEIVGGWCGT